MYTDCRELLPHDVVMLRKRLGFEFYYFLTKVGDDVYLFSVKSKRTEVLSIAECNKRYISRLTGKYRSMFYERKVSRRSCLGDLMFCLTVIVMIYVMLKLNSM